MTSGSFAHRGVPVPKVNSWRSSSPRRRLTQAGLCAATAATLVVGSAIAAFGNAANPTSASATMWACGHQPADVAVPSCPDGSEVVQVTGSWSWGELANQKSSPQKDCAGRYGVGWSVDWWGMGSSKTPANAMTLQGSTVEPATKTTAPQPGHWGTLNPDGVWQVKSTKTYFHTSALYNGFLADLCDKSHADQTPTGPTGGFSAVAVYPNENAVPPQLCVNFYDPHGKQSQWSSSQSDNYASKDGDNSIQTNDFNPATLQDTSNCFVVKPATPSGSPHVVVGKTGPATGTAGGAGTYTITLTNDGKAATSGATSFVDMLPVGETFQSVAASSDAHMSCQANTQNPREVDCSYADSIAVGDSKSVAVVIGYDNNTGGKALKDCAGLMPTGATACVTTFIPKPGALDLAIVKTASASSVVAGKDVLTYTLQVTNISDQPTTGPVTVTDTVPGDLSIAGTPTGAGWTCGAVGAAVTCTLDNPPLAAGQAASPITVTTKVLSSAVGFLVNTGVVSTPGDVNPANNRSTVRTPVTHVLGTKIVKSPAKPAAVRATRVPGVLPFTGWNTSTAITLALALLVAGLRLINLAARRKRT